MNLYFSIKSTFFILIVLYQILIFVKCIDFNFKKSIGVIGSNNSLTCHINDINNSKNLISWFKSYEKEAFYTLNAKLTNIFKKAKHILNDNFFFNRAYIDTSNNASVLIIKNLKLEDASNYRCEIIVKNNKTKNLSFDLEIIDCSKEVFIKDAFGKKQKNNIKTDFYNENGHLTLICETQICTQPVNLYWYRNDELIDDSFEITKIGYARNELAILYLKREYLLNNFTCKAFNTNLTKSTSSSVILELNLRPLSVKITGPNHSVSDGSKIVLTCKSEGARPNVVISWWFRNKNLKKNNFISKLNNISMNKFENYTFNNITNSYISSNVFRPNMSSKIEFLVDKDYNDKQIICRTDHSFLPDSVLEDIYNFDVLYAPKVSLTLGSNSFREKIYEKSNITFVCHVSSNPKPLFIKWFFNNKLLNESNLNLENILFLNNDTELILKIVDKSFSGIYNCLAINTEGETLSENAELKIFHSPICLHENIQTFGLTILEHVNISCHVSAYPQVQKFKWTLESLSLPKPINLYSFKNHIDNNISTSILHYSARTLHSYGQLQCYAINSVGHQQNPCTFNIIPAKTPEKLIDCILSNVNISSFTIKCKPGNNGGLKQTFHLDIYRSRSGKLVKKINTTSSPLFQVKDLTRSTPFVLILYSSNLKGKSDLTTFIVSTMPFPNINLVVITPLIAVIMGIIGSLTMCAIIIVIISKIKSFKRHKEMNKMPSKLKNESIIQDLSFTNLKNSIIDKQPLPIDCNLKDKFVSSDNTSLHDLLNGNFIENIK